jgi:hypothetical protein
VFWGELSDLKEVKDERPDLLQDAVQRGLVQEHVSTVHAPGCPGAGARNADSTVRRHTSPGSSHDRSPAWGRPGVVIEIRAAASGHVRNPREVL